MPWYIWIYLVLLFAMFAAGIIAADHYGTKRWKLACDAVSAAASMTLTCAYWQPAFADKLGWTAALLFVFAVVWDFDSTRREFAKFLGTLDPELEIPEVPVEFRDATMSFVVAASIGIIGAIVIPAYIFGALVTWKAFAGS